MKTKNSKICLLATLLTLGVDAQLAPLLSEVMVVVPYQAVKSSAHERVWRQVTVDAEGVTNVQSYIELATGLNYWNEETGLWEESKEQFQITQEGYAVAAQGQHKVILAPDIGMPNGAVDFLGPDDLRLLSNPMGLAYRDMANGKTVLIAGVTNCIGVLASSNVILFPAAFDTVRAAISYTYTRAGLEQDVILYEKLLPPSEYGLSDQTTVLEMWTEFLNPPEPRITPSDSKGDAADQILDFGQTRMADGIAYLQKASALKPVALQKAWVNIEGRSFLVENVPYGPLKPLLDELQASIGTTPKKAQTVKVTFPSRSRLVAQAFPARSKPGQMASIQRGQMNREAGLVLDYQTINTSLANYTFAADTNYFISASVILSGTTTFEGNSVLKFGNAPAKIRLYSAVCKTGPYRMAILTTKDDDTVGEIIATSTHTPTVNGATYLDTGVDDILLKYFRFSYAGTALKGKYFNNIWHCQFVRCGTGIDFGHSDQQGGLYNVLFAKCATALLTDGADLHGEHMTADGSDVPNAKFNSSSSDSGTLVNSIFSSCPTAGGLNLDNCSTTGVSYDSIGAGNYYLFSGTAGSQTINANLRNDLKSKTIFRPTEIISDISIVVQNQF